MRYVLIPALAVVLTACASTTPTSHPSPAPAASAAAAAPAKVPQCYNGDDSKFHPVGTAATVAGVAVVCTAAGDGKSAQWMGQHHKK